VAKDRAEADVYVVHPFNFKRLLLTGLPVALPHDAEEGGEGGGQLDCSLLRMLLALAFSFSDETRIGAVELLLMLAHVPAQRTRARR
jgi:ABC-type transport system involved in cytochrome c biogenesis permease component